MRGKTGLGRCFFVFVFSFFKIVELIVGLCAYGSVTVVKGKLMKRENLME